MMAFSQELLMQAQCAIHAACFYMRSLHRGDLPQIFCRLLLPKSFFPVMITTYRYLECTTQNPERIYLSQSVNSGILYSDSLAKYAAAFFNISHSMRNTLFSLRNRASSCASEALPFWAKARPALTVVIQCPSVFGESARRSAVSIWLRPSWRTMLTACSLNSRVYRVRVAIGLPS